MTFHSPLKALVFHASCLSGMHNQYTVLVQSVLATLKIVCPSTGAAAEARQVFEELTAGQLPVGVLCEAQTAHDVLHHKQVISELGLPSTVKAVLAHRLGVAAALRYPTNGRVHLSCRTYSCSGPCVS